MTNSVEDQYVNLLARSIPAATIKRNEELFLSAFCILTKSLPMHCGNPRPEL